MAERIADRMAELKDYMEDKAAAQVYRKAKKIGNLDGKYAEAIGLIEGYFEQIRRSVEDAPATTTRAFRWDLSSSFSGWLPWETGTRRRGVIR